MTMPAPTPAPIATKRTSPAPRALPCMHSPTAPRVASFSTRTGAPNRASHRAGSPFGQPATVARQTCRVAGSTMAGPASAIASTGPGPARRAPWIRGVGRRRLDRLQHLPYFRRITEVSHSGPSLDPSRLADWLAIPSEELVERSPVPLTICASKEELYRHFAQAMFDEAAGAAERGEELAVIVPLGPKAHYSLLARMVNEARLSLEHVTYFGMDQWLDWQGRPLPWEHAFNLEAYFHRHYLELLNPELRPRAENVLFPSVLELDRVSDEIARRPVATTYGGFGFQGPLASNEAPSNRWSPVTLEILREEKSTNVPLALA